MTQLTVHKLDEHGREVWHYPARVLERRPNCVRLEAFFDRQDMDLGFTTFKQGDRFVESYYTDRWYNVFAVYDRDSGELKGWYCNVCRPAQITETAVRCEDLALDVWVAPDGTATVMDEDEFAELGLSEVERQKSQGALQSLLALASEGKLPA